MTRTMYDSIDASMIPPEAEIVAGYVDGHYAWADADWARFPNAVKVPIAVFASTNAGDVLDCEQYDATPEDCPGWIKMRQAAGLAVPTIYCGRAAMAAVQQHCAGLTYDLWVADWTGVPHLPAGAMACQYAAKGIYDISLCADEWPRTSQETPTDELTGALAYVTDTLGDRVTAAIAELGAVQTEMQRVRTQFIGPRP